MDRQKTRIRWDVVMVTMAVVGLLFFLGMQRIRIDSDILNSLPSDDPVLADAAYIFRNHPIQDQIALDISLEQSDPDALVAAAQRAEASLVKSGLFESVGTSGMQRLFPLMLEQVMESLPLLFTPQELERRVSPLLHRGEIKKVLEKRMADLANLEGIGQAGMIARDPLGLAWIVLSRLSDLSPGGGATLYRGQLLTQDGRSLLILLKPRHSATDTDYARRIQAAIEDARREIARGAGGRAFTVTAVGAYRAALDNEDMAKSDVELALTISTLGIALLLILSFPRPLFGLLSMVPAMVGTVGSLFVYSLFHDSISILALGFGGAVVSITVDHGIAFLLFLDRNEATSGRQAAHEVWTAGLFATLTTIGAFLALVFSGFEILSQIGQFTAMGHAFSFIFAHTVFPMAFPAVAPAARRKVLPVRRVARWIGADQRLRKVFIALALFCVMLFFSKPDFRIDIGAMNSVTAETLAAEKTVSSHWGTIFTKVYLLVEGSSLGDLRAKGDRLCALLESDRAGGRVASFFNSSMIVPGEERGGVNARAWNDFWSPARTIPLKRDLASVSREVGFSAGAFDPFLKSLKYSGTVQPVPEALAPILGITRKGNLWLQTSTVTLGPSFSPDGFHRRYSPLARIFDPANFSRRLSETLSSTFLWMILILGIGAVLLLLIFLMDLTLTLVSSLMVIFTFVCTLGTLHLLGRPLDIPSLMIAIIILGMGIDYTLFIVKAYQRHPRDTRQPIDIMNLAVLLASTSTMIGFGSMVLARHTLLRSVGIVSLTAIVFSIVGAYMILPPLLRRLFPPLAPATAGLQAGSREHRRRIMRRLRHLEAHPRLFAFFKMKTDPMFRELGSMVPDPKRIIDIGTGFGVPALWLLELYPEASLYGIEPDHERARFADMMIAGRGSIAAGAAPEMPAIRGGADTALMIDMVHHLDDGELNLALSRIHSLLLPGGRIVIRTTIPLRRRTFLRSMEELRLRLSGRRPAYRSREALCLRLRRRGFRDIQVTPSGTGREEFWFTARA
ncbi:MAG: MMPL family transporter [Spirochaetes bacterium]|nr:MMPL family transporter [Spirochaetota bacterium]